MVHSVDRMGESSPFSIHKPRRPHENSRRYFGFIVEPIIEVTSKPVPHNRGSGFSAGGVALGKRDVPGWPGPGFDPGAACRIASGGSVPAYGLSPDQGSNPANIPSSTMVRHDVARPSRQRGASLRRGGERGLRSGNRPLGRTCFAHSARSHDAPRAIALPLMADSRCPIRAEEMRSSNNTG